MLIKLLRVFMAPHRGALSLVLGFSLVGTLASLFLPSLNAAIIDQGIARGDMDFIWRTGGVMLAVSILQGMCAMASVFFAAKAAMGFGRDLRGALFGKVLSFSSRELNCLGAPSLITRNTNDVLQVQSLAMMSCTMLVSTPMTMIGGVFMAIREDSGLSWLLLVAIPVLALAVAFLMIRVRPIFAAMQIGIDAVNRVMREQATGVRVVRAFVREAHEEARFAIANAALADSARALGVWLASLQPGIMFLMNAFSIAALWFGAHRIAAGHMQVGALTAFVAYLAQILTSVMTASFLLMMVPRAAVCAGRIQEVLDTDSSVPPPATGLVSAGHGSMLELSEATFTYPGAEVPILQGISLVATAGQTIAIIGSTGAGKTTLLSMMARLIDATAGRVAVDGIDVREFQPDALGRRIGLVPQQAFLFSGTVASNLRHGKADASDEELWHALHVAQADDFVRGMAGGLDAVIAQGGTNLSGGQRQRLAIARALVRRPGIYLLDDPFAALDAATDARLRGTLKAEIRDAVVIIVSQRVRTIKDADRILVLEDGAVVGDGDHQTLLRTCPTYLEIVDSQLCTEEAA